MDKSGFFTSLINYLKANRTFFALIALILVSTMGFLWWRADFTLDLNKFFAAAPDGGDGGGGGSGSSCAPTGNCSTGDCDGDGFLNPSVYNGNDCDDSNKCIGGQSSCRQKYCGNNICESGNETATSCSVDCRSGSTPAPTGTRTPAPTASTGCPSGFTDWGGGLCWRVAGGTLSTAACQPSQSGLMYQDWEVINNSPDSYYVRLNGFKDPIKGCTGTVAGPSGGTAVTNGNIALNARQTIRVSYDASGRTCGRIQLDGCFFNNRTGSCRNSSGGLALGAVIDYGVSCNLTPVPTATRTPGPTLAPTRTPVPTQLPTTTPTPLSLVCSPSSQAGAVGQTIRFNASGGTGTYSWFAPGGNPGTGAGTQFQTIYSVVGNKTVTLASGGNQTTCQVSIAESRLTPTPTQSPTPTSTSRLTPTPTTSRTPTPTPTACLPPSCPTPPPGCTVKGGDRCNVQEFCSFVCPSPTPTITSTPTPTATATITPTPTPTSTNLSCAPVSQTIGIGQPASFTAGGASGVINWSAPGGNPASATGTASSFSSAYYTPGNYLVTVTANGQSANCSIFVQSGQPPSNPSLSLQKTVRNLSQNSGESDSVSTNPSDTVEFIIRIQGLGVGTVNQVIVRDILPTGLSYLPGSTIIDNAPAADGLIGYGLNIGDVQSGRIVIIRFRAQVAPEPFWNTGSSTLVNIAVGRGQNTPDLSDAAFLTVQKNIANLSLSLLKLGRNISTNEAGERSVLYAKPNQVLEFILRVRSNSSVVLPGVTLRDILPQGLSLVPGSVRQNGSPVPDNLISGGLLIGQLVPGQEIVVTFRASVAGSGNLPAGLTTLINSAQVNSDGQQTLWAQLPVVLSNTTTIAQTPTGPAESTILALIVSAIITVLYVGYTSTDVYRRREAKSLAKKSGTDRNKFDFRR